MANLNDWNVAAANNNSAAPDGWPEGMNYSDVNNTGRENMAVVARYFKDINGSLTTAGTANTYTVTLNAGYAAYFDGMMFSAQINVTNTGATTLNVNSLGAKAVVNGSGAALVSGDLVAGQVYTFAYDGTDFHMVGALPSTISGRAVSATTLAASGEISADDRILLEESGVTRWAMISFSGSLDIERYNSSGVFQDKPLTFDSAGDATFGGDVELTTGMLNVNTSTANAAVELQVNGDVLIGSTLVVNGTLGTGTALAQGAGIFIDGATSEIRFDTGRIVYGSGGAAGSGTNDLSFVSFGELFLSLPTSAGTSGSLWNDSGTVKVA